MNLKLWLAPLLTTTVFLCIAGDSQAGEPATGGLVSESFETTKLSDAKPVPDMQVLPQPYDQASFEHLGRELTRYHFGPQLRRPFWYPIVGPSGRSLTRMNMPGDPGRSLTRAAQPQDSNKPEDPLGHSHQTSVWISHKDVNGIDFWRDGGPLAGQIVHQTRREGLEYQDGPPAASLLSLNHWNDPQGKTLMVERRRTSPYVCATGCGFIPLCRMRRNSTNNGRPLPPANWAR